MDKFPSWYYGPNGQSGVFESEADVPKGWEDHPTKVKGSAATPKAQEALDAHGHPFSEDLHAATQTQTKDGLWRMKVGVKRPDPAPGYPLDL